MKSIRAVILPGAIALAAAAGMLTLREGPERPEAVTARPSASAGEAGHRRPASSAPRPHPAPALPRMPKLITSSPSTAMDERRHATVMKFLAETDGEKRRYLVPELVDLNDPQCVPQILELLRTETDPRVRDNLIAFLGYMPYSTNHAEEIIAEARRLHSSPMDGGDRMALQRMAIELQHPASAQFLRDVYHGSDTLPEERVNAGEGLVRLHHEVGLVSSAEAGVIVGQMKLDAQAMADPVERAQAYRALSVTRYDNREFFRQMLNSESDPDCRNVLNAYAQADLQPSPTRGPLKTPWPSPTPWAAATPVPSSTPAGTPRPWVEPTPQYLDEVPLSSQPDSSQAATPAPPPASPAVPTSH